MCEARTSHTHKYSYNSNSFSKQLSQFQGSERFFLKEEKVLQMYYKQTKLEQNFI